MCVKDRSWLYLFLFDNNNDGNNNIIIIIWPFERDKTGIPILFRLYLYNFYLNFFLFKFIFYLNSFIIKFQLPCMVQVVFLFFLFFIFFFRLPHENTKEFRLARHSPDQETLHQGPTLALSTSGRFERFQRSAGFFLNFFFFFKTKTGDPQLVYRYYKLSPLMPNHQVGRS